MDDMDDLVAFAAMADAGGLAAASDATGLPRSALSRRLKRLEQRLGVPLAKRSPQSFSLTQAGEELHAQCQEAFSRLKDAQAEIAGAFHSPRGLVRVTASVPIAHVFLVEELDDFFVAHPEVWVSVDVSSTKLNLARAPFDLALRVGDAKGDDQVARLLFREREALYVASSLASSLGAVERPEDLAGRRSVLCTADLGGSPSRVLRLVNGKETCEVAMPARLKVNDPVAGLRAGEAGLGIVSLPRFIGDRGVRTGTLTPVLPAWTSPPVEVRAILPQRPTAAARALLDHLVVAARRRWPT